MSHFYVTHSQNKNVLRGISASWKLSYTCLREEVQTTLRVMENLGGRVFPLLGDFPLMGALWNRHKNFKAKLYTITELNENNSQFHSLNETFEW